MIVIHTISRSIWSLILMFRYFSNLSYGMKILWCYLIWYIYFSCKYFESDPDLWLRTLGIALLVGLVLNLNAFYSLKGIINAKNKWQIFRFFAIPFCVSSFPVLVKDKGFLLFFSPRLEENLIAFSLCILLLSFSYMGKRITHGRSLYKKNLIHY